jgi:hypothetical protein
MPLRRAFLLGAATIVCVAALIAVVTILNGSFGETEGKIFATLATTFVAGSMLIAGLALLARRVSRPLGELGIFFATLGFLLWSAQIWGGYHSNGYWRLLGVLTAWAGAVLVVTTTRLMISSPLLVRRLYPLTAAAAAAAALTATIMLLREQGDGWQVLAVLIILTVLGETLAPILERYSASEENPEQRLLGEVGGVEVVAVRRSGPRVVTIGDATVELAPGESLVVKQRT